ncbi:hypothetical protein [Streptomyces sp. CC210A]|uniref:hypothetical protein n=1 Tax=Streptomyces sp. CC210A TaxID=2898184 RepID=UPI001F442057|nr:hypothetical protein [Streptomyces sp. CC210A]
MNDRVKHLVSELAETIEHFRADPEGERGWDEEHDAGVDLAEVAERLILALHPNVWPAAWFKPDPESPEPDRPVSAYEERLVEELLAYLDR